MARLEWNKQGERSFETGVDRGVFYPDLGPGIAWNGLISVTETPDGGDANSYYLDGQKYLDVVNPEDFSGSIEAISYPPEFVDYDGMSRFKGLTITGQKRRSFGLSYRTLVGNDTKSIDFAYKIHLVYEAKALPAERNRNTIGEAVELSPITWNIVATPVSLAGRRKTAHFVVDSRDNDPQVLAVLESYLYGSTFIEPQLPSIAFIADLLGGWQHIDIDGPITFHGVWPNNEKSELINLPTNPSFETTSGTVEVRRNYAWDPRATVNSTSGTNKVGWQLRWFGAGGGAGVGTSVRGATDGPLLPDGSRINTYQRKTWTVAPSNNSDTGFAHTNSPDAKDQPPDRGMVVQPGQVWTVSRWLRASALRGIGIIQRATWYTADGTYLLTKDAAPVAFAQAGEWQRLSATYTAPAGAYRMGILTYLTSGTPWQPGDSLDGTGLLVEKTSIVGSYFDHLYSPDSDLTPSSTGTPNLSPSILTGLALKNSPGENVSVIASTMWAKSGVRSVRSIPKSTENDSRIVVGGGSGGGMRLGMVAGNTYTAIATCRLSAPLTGSLFSYSRSIAAYFKVGASYTAIKSDVAPNQAGETTLRLTFTIPPTATEAFIRLYNGASIGGGNVWWDNFMLIKGAYDGPYWDGNTPPNTIFYQKQPLKTSWSDLPNDSSSIGTYYTNLPENPKTGDLYTIDGDLYLYHGDVWQNLGASLV